MAVDGISSYLTSNIAGSTKSSGSANDNSNNTLSMDDFFSLMVAQLSNQDMYNTTDNTEFISQMAQFSMVQALADLSEQSNKAQGISMIGKSATLTVTDDNDIEQTISGVIQGVTMYNGDTEIVINGEVYSMDLVKEIYDLSLIESK